MWLNQGETSFPERFLLEDAQKIATTMAVLDVVAEKRNDDTEVQEEEKMLQGISLHLEEVKRSEDQEHPAEAPSIPESQSWRREEMGD